MNTLCRLATASAHTSAGLRGPAAAADAAVPGREPGKAGAGAAAAADAVDEEQEAVAGPTAAADALPPPEADDGRDRATATLSAGPGKGAAVGAVPVPVPYPCATTDKLGPDEGGKDGLSRPPLLALRADLLPLGAGAGAASSRQPKISPWPYRCAWLAGSCLMPGTRGFMWKFGQTAVLSDRLFTFNTSTIRDKTGATCTQHV